MYVDPLRQKPDPVIPRLTINSTVQSHQKDLIVISAGKEMKLLSRIQNLQVATKKARHKAGEVVQDLVRVGEVAVGAGVFGFWAGKRSLDKAATSGPNIFGVPADLAAGIACYAAALMGVAGAETHFKAIGDGALGAYFSTLGYEYGKGANVGWKLPAVLGDGASAGSLPAHRASGESLTAEDLAKLAAKA
jgi:hypothetical protein